jgi:hypothetical protein
VNIEFVSGLMEIHIQMAPMNVSLSKENIKEFIHSANAIFIILIQESREYKSFLRKLVYVNGYECMDGHTVEIFRTSTVDKP